MSHLGAFSRVIFDLSVFGAVAKQRMRRTLVYLVLLVVIAATASAALWTMRARDLVKRLDPHLDEIPTISIQNGRASADVEQPWVKRLGRDDLGHEIVLIIDTTGTRKDFEDGEIGVFLKRTVVVVNTVEKKEEIPLSRFPDMTIGPDIVRDFIHSFMKKLPFYLGAAFFIWYLFMKTITAFLLVLAALIGSRNRLSFGALFSIGVYALTPAIIAGAVLPLVGVTVPMFWLIYLAIAVAYAILGAQRASATPPPDSTAAL